MILADFISPDVRAARSVNLERDRGNQATLRHYHLTGKGLEILSRLASALNGERVSAWSLTGPYGMGKSSFANFLMALCGPANEEETRIARQMLEEKDSSLSTNLFQLLSKHSSREKGLFRVGVTASFESINRTLSRGLRQALLKTTHWPRRHRQELSDLILTLDGLLAQEVPETRRLVKLFRSAKELYGAPVVLMVDEFGKNLEYMARFPAQGDLFILQALAESATTFIWVCLHQAFEEYASKLSTRQLQEWGKVQGRFEDVSFVEPRKEMIRFICETLTRNSNDPSLSKAVRNWAKHFHREAKQLDIPDLKDLDLDTIERFYPLNPLAAVALPELCVRFAQNDRSLFAFLCSGEPNALPAFLATHSLDPSSGQMATFGPDLLYDYFLSSSSTTLMNRPESHRWIEIHDIIERSRSIDPYHLSVLKVIGLLNLISGPSRFRSSHKLVSFAFLRPPSKSDEALRDLEGAIDESIQKGVLVYRQYADEYRLWEGTDFDIPAAIRERKRLFASQSLEAIIKETVPLSPLTASKHSYVTGTLRHFERRWCGPTELTSEAAKESVAEFDGLVLHCFGNEREPPALPSTTEDGKPIVLCYAACEDQIRDLVLEAAAAKAVLHEAPELVHDGVARKEARFRAYMAEERLRGYLNELFSPGNSEVIWHALGQYEVLTSNRDLSRLLSRCCDLTYSSCPVIRNELINRGRLSSAAAKARRELMDAMVLKEVHENLGFEGTGPEVAIYRTMLLAEKLHRLGEDGTWQFVAPDNGCSYYPAWRALTEAIESAGDQSVPISDLIQMLRKPPFGLKSGPIPLLLSLFFIVKSDEIALYQEGAFVPTLGPEELELMTKRPEYFAVRQFPQGKLRGRVFQLYMSLLKAQSSGGTKQVRNATLISVVGPLVQFVKNLQPYVLHNKSLNQYTQNVRHALQQARDPVDLLFLDLPQAVGLPPFKENEPLGDEVMETFKDRFTKSIVELRDAYPRLLGSVERVVLQAFDCDEDVGQLRALLQKRASALLTRCNDRDLKPFLAALTNFSGTDQDWVVSVATIVSQRPVDSWREIDLEDFSVRMRDYVGRFTTLETLLARSGRVLPVSDGRREPRMLTLTRPDGTIASDIVWMDETRSLKAKEVVEKLVCESGEDKAVLEAILLMLSERLLSGRSDTRGEEASE